MQKIPENSPTPSNVTQNSPASTSMIERLSRDLTNLSDQIRHNVDVLESLKRISSILVAAGLYKSLLQDEVLEAVLEKVETSVGERNLIMAKILLKFLETPKRFFIAGKHLKTAVKLANFCASDSHNENILIGISILQILFDIGEEISESILELDGLDSIVKNCSSKDFKVLEACSLAVLKVVLNGGKHCENQLLKNDVQLKWLIPMLNIYDNKSIKFYAYLSVTYLRKIRGKCHEILWNGFLNDINFWISNEETCEKLLRTVSLNSFDKKKDIKKILPMLSVNCPISHTLGAFLLNCEIVRSSRDKSDIKVYSKNEDLVKGLKRVVLISNEIAKKFASTALQNLDETIPSPVPSDLKWETLHTQEWLKVIDFFDYDDYLSKIKIEDILLLQASDMKDKIFMFNSESRNKFLNEIEILKQMTSKNSLSKKNSMKLEFWRNESQESGSSSSNSPCVKEDLNASQSYFVSLNENKSLLEKQLKFKKTTDVFISYRRSNGSELASLLKVHLMMRNYKVFLDVENLTAGHFGNSLIKNVQQAKNFVLILTPNALDRCIDDHDNKDWIKKEISTALLSNCNIIPIAKDFDNKIFYHNGLPEDIRSLVHLNQIMWHHDAQVSSNLKRAM